MDRSYLFAPGHNAKLLDRVFTAGADALARARELLTVHPVVDGHNDLPWALRMQVGYDLGQRDLAEDQSAHLHTDLPRLRAGGVGAQFWSVYVPGEYAGDAAVSACLEQIDAVLALVARYPEQLRLALTADDRCMNIMPLFHIHGLIAATLSSLAAGASVFCTPGFNALRFFAWLDEAHSTWYTAVPTMHQAILTRADRNPESIARNPLRFVRSSSASLPPHSSYATPLRHRLCANHHTNKT